MSSTPRDLPPVLPDEVPFDAKAYAWGAAFYDQGKALAAAATIPWILVADDDPPEARLVWRKSATMGYLAAQKVAAERGCKSVWSG